MYRPISRQLPIHSSRECSWEISEFVDFLLEDRQLMRFFKITKMKSVCTLYIREVKVIGMRWNLTEGSIG
jgi:hypothetical protein